jgi:N-acyl-D-aspartate/D-glutamate deacylase
MNRGVYIDELADLPLAERAARMRDTTVKRRVLTDIDREVEDAGSMAALAGTFRVAAARLYPLTDGFDYEPTEDKSLGARAVREGKSTDEVLYDYLTENDGKGFAALLGTNFQDGNLDVVREMLAHPETITGLADAGAHVNLICDGSMPTTQLKLWGGGRSRGEALPIEFIVEKQTRRNARLYGMRDRGTLEVGMRADLNVINLEALNAEPPISHNDLPAGGARLLQKISGYEATVLNGTITRRDDKDTGARPGGLVRGAGWRA